MKKKNNLIDLQRWRKHNLHDAMAQPYQKPPKQTKPVDSALFFEPPKKENDTIADEQLSGMLIW